MTVKLDQCNEEKNQLIKDINARNTTIHELEGKVHTSATEIINLLTRLNDLELEVKRLTISNTAKDSYIDQRDENILKLTNINLKLQVRR